MKRFFSTLPISLTLFAAVFMLAHGPIQQLPNYHAFADVSNFFGIPHAADVLSNLGFALIACWGILRLWPMREHDLFRESAYGYGLFLLALFCTALGSSFYHLAPDNMRLVWDRLPIAWACAGLLSAVRTETQSNVDGKMQTVFLGLLATASVVWWYITDLRGMGDLRPYLLLQGLPLVLIPLWHYNHRSHPRDRIACGAALLLYSLAKVAELNDHQIQSFLGYLSGHTLKHFLATVAAWILVARLVQRTRK